ncbi:MAG TPA: YicC family protein [Thermopetrobacter sp.]|nr:YicC family protein [Thermopetrobacter sp.]
MALYSMTGFARAGGETAALSWTWEARSVNGRGLDVRLRLPNGAEKLDAAARQAVAERFARGNFQIGLQVTSRGPEGGWRLDEAHLDWLIGRLMTARRKLGGMAGPVDPLRLLLARGVIEQEEEDLPALLEEHAQELLASLGEALDDLKAMRAEEGRRLQAVIAGHIDTIAELTGQARRNPARTPQAIRARLTEQVNRLLEAAADLDEQRLHQEAALLATRADIAEELDRLEAHVAAARDLLAGDEPAGRKLDFLAQEFHREANTICSKSNDAALSAIGLELKAVIDQLREQVQNVE